MMFWSFNSRKWLIVGALVLKALPIFGQEQKKADFRVGVNADSIVLEGSDIQAALALSETLLIKIMGRNNSIHSITTYSSEDRLVNLIETNQINMAFATSLQYVKLAEKMKVTAIATVRPFSRGFDRLVLLVNRRSGITKLSELKGKELNLKINDSVSRAYIRVLLWKEGLGSPETFFSKIPEHKKARSAILDVFFEETDSCIVSENIFNSLAEINPQLKETLVLLQISEPIANGVIIVTPDMNPNNVKVLIKESTTLHEEEDGKQFLLLFKIKQLQPVDDSDFDYVRKLWSELKKLEGQKELKPEIKKPEIKKPDRVQKAR